MTATTMSYTFTDVAGVMAPEDRVEYVALQRSLEQAITILAMPAMRVSFLVPHSQDARKMCDAIEARRAVLSDGCVAIDIALGETDAEDIFPGQHPAVTQDWVSSAIAAAILAV